MNEASPRIRGWVIAVTLALGLRALLATQTELYFDEAYYWVWSRHLAGGYFDHAPLIAWLIRLCGVRPAALLCGLGTAAAVYGLAASLHGTRAGAWQATAVWCAMPASALAGVFATPDAPLLLTWTLSLAALRHERWAALGFTGGLALLSKYTAGLLAPVHALYALWQRRFATQSWVSAGIAAVLFLPPVIWNATDDWAGFRFQLHHGLGGGGGVRSFAEFVGGQLLVGGPFVFPWALLWALQGPREQRLLRLSTAVPLVLFALASLRARGEANWAGMAYPAVAVALGGVRPRTAWIAVVTGVLVIALGTTQLLHPWIDGPLRTPVERTHGWTALSRLRDEGFTAAVAPNYQLASEAAYYGRVLTGVVGPARPSQFDFWPSVSASEGALAFVSEGAEPPPELLRNYEAEGPRLWPAEYAGRTLHTFAVWKLSPRVARTAP